MFFFADMLWENSDFIGNSYPPEVCGAILRSMEKLSRIKSEGVITGMTPSEFSVLRGTVPQEAQRHRGECSGYRGAYGSIGSGGVQNAAFPSGERLD